MNDLESTMINLEKESAKAITNDLYQRFIAYIDASPKTVATYTGYLRQFSLYLRRNGISQPTRETILAYRDDLKQRCSPSTVAGYITVLRLFFRWTSMEGLYPDIAANIKGSHVTPGHKKDYLTIDQVKNLLQSVETDTAQGKRNFSMIALMVTGGLRDIEVSRADIRDIGIAGGEPVLYVMGKGRSDRSEFVKLPAAVESALRKYLQTRPDAKPEDPLFISMSHNSFGNRLSTRSISGIVKHYLVSAGYISTRLSAHSLRHSSVTIALLNGNTLQEAQQFARHRNISTTEIYAHNLDRLRNHCEESIADSIFE